MRRANRTAAAESDLQGILFQIAIEEERPLTAERILRGIAQRCDQLAEFAPNAIQGTAAPQIGRDVRLVPFKRWVILFRYEADSVTILRIADGSEDYLSWKIGD
jgi:plasmid stabilization system protein ParE